MDNSRFQFRPPNSPKINTVSTTEQPTSNKINIYQKSAHIIQKYPQSAKSITLSKSADLDSIIIIDNSGKIIPFSYIPPTDFNRTLTRNLEVEVVKDEKLVSGKVISLTTDNVTLLSKDKIIDIRHPDKIIVSINEDITLPKLVLDNATLPFTLSYLLNNISWSCVGTILISTTKDVMNLRLAANITNNTENDINAETIIISGEMYSRKRPNNNDNVSYMAAPMMKQATMKQAISSERIQSSLLEDYVKYPVGNKLLRISNIVELGTWEFPFLKVYIHQTSEDNVNFGYRFNAIDYLPSCSVDLYSTDKDMSIDSYVGSNQIDEKQKGDEVDIIVGDTTLIQCVSTVIISNDVIVNTPEEANMYKIPFNKDNSNHGWHVITEDVTVEITNHQTKSSLLILKHYVGNKQLVDLRCDSYKNRKDGFLEWYFKIDANKGVKRFNCQVLTAVYY